MKKTPQQPQPLTGPALFTPSAAATQLSCSRATVYRLIASGHLPTVHIASGLTRISREDLAAYIARNRVDRSA